MLGLGVVEQLVLRLWLDEYEADTGRTMENSAGGVVETSELLGELDMRPTRGGEATTAP